MKLFNKKNKRCANTSSAFSPVLREFKIATKRHLDSVKRNIFQNSALYGTPWFMIIGPEGSGKTTLLSACSLHFPLKYPLEKDGDTVSGVKWQFGNKAVWLDTPGKLLNSGFKDLFKTVYDGLSIVRPKRPIDGIICIINVGDILNGDQKCVKALAGSIRAKLDELITFWGVELPVFCIFSKMDTVPGFFEFFNDASVQWGDQLLGATLSTEQQKDSPRRIFQKEHELLCSSLKTLRLKRLSKEKDESVRRLICRFVIQFEGLQAKAADFFGELFKESIYEGKPVFKGFYFVSCKAFEMTTKSMVAPQISTSGLSKTIVNHPLNPHRNEDCDQTSIQSATKQIRSFFTNKLFDEVIPNGTQVLLRTSKSSRKDFISYWSLTGIISLIFILTSIYLFYSFQNASCIYSKIRSEVLNVSIESKNLTDSYIQLGKTSEQIQKFKGFNKNGVPLTYGLGFVRKKDLYNKLKDNYFKQVWNLLVIPSTANLEYGIKRLNSSYGMLSNDDYSSLYRMLKTYLSISEEVSKSREKIDTLLIRDMMEQGIYQTILQREGSNRLPVYMETILKESIGLYNYFLRTGEMPLIQQNQDLVKQARTRLAHIPDGKVIYESIRNRLQSTTPFIPFDKIAGEKNNGYLSSDKRISIIYTQEGWDRFVEDEISKSTKDPFKVDWVLGSSYGSNIPAFDKKQLKSDLISFYVEDLCNQWLSLLLSIKMDQPGDMASSAIFLQKLSSERSELSLLLENVLALSKVSVIPEEPIGLKAVKKTTSANKEIIREASTSAKNILGIKDPSDQIKQYFESLQSFMRSEGRYGGITAYRERMSMLSEAMLECAKQGNVTEVFNGKDGDPLLNGWLLTENIIASLPDHLQLSASSILKKPFELSAAAITRSLSKELNSKWHSDVAALFMNRYSGKYPFSKSKDEASLEDVMDFFRPNTGIVFGFISRNFSPYIVKDNNGWRSQPVGCITLSFSKQFFELLTEADKINNAFFNRDGSQKQQTIMLTPMEKNKVPGSITIDKQEYRILPGYAPVRIQWPDPRQSNEVVLRIFVNDKYTDETVFNGQWALVRLFESSSINVQNNSSFVANWQRNIQNMIIVYYGCQVRVSGSVLPFTEKAFTKISCPSEIIAIR